MQADLFSALLVAEATGQACDPKHPAEGFRFAVRLLEMYRSAAWLYHHGPADIESPMSDALFDEVERMLGMPKALGHTIQLTDAEQQRAIAWARTAQRSTEKEPAA